MIPSDDPTRLSLLFHLNSEPWSADDVPSLEFAHEVKHLDNVLARFQLPSPSDSGLSQLIHGRQSKRDFPGNRMSLIHLSALLAATYGAIENFEHAVEAPMLRRSVPSAGGLYPLEIYLFLQQVEELDDGIYHYDVVGHTLEQMVSGDVMPKLKPAFYSYSRFAKANAVICHAAAFARTQNKYGARGYRYILLEAGHAAQNLCLAATELGLGSLCLGGFVDSILNQILGLQPTKEGVVYAVAVG